ncbi:MAG: methyltransferase domain-containing protein [Alphaproteobacteria bacterium]|nr:methyltransferase domain-containing protein [Alphaproteobacteria bacterium]
MSALLLLALGCAHRAPVAPEPAPPVEAAAPAPVSEPGINDNFLDPNMDPTVWVERFQAESREVVAHQPEILAALSLTPGAAVADIGAGTGLYTSAFAEAVGPEGRVYAVDISPVFLERLRGMAADRGWSQVSVVEAGADSSRLEPGSIDVAFVCDTYHHFEQPEPTLASLFAALRPGGHLYVLDFERIEGTSKEWTLNHVRAGKDVFATEIEAAGFTTRTDLDVGLEENYLLRFTRP